MLKKTKEIDKVLPEYVCFQR